ncbi:hypothetical protein PUN28_009722 [Cardiocondyla obscurior]|uniref:Protein kinase A anchor protein nuclear localisation signal domain-containing protein n=1 Tax=Cardiocondyla obscurior TaxID=286306 RepID=A0AAW2FPM4_9HYME
MTSADAHVTIFSVLPSPEAKILTKNKKKIFENLATNHPETLTKTKKKFLKFGNVSMCGDIIDKNKKIFENLATNLRAVTSADAHVTIFSQMPVTIFSVLLSPETKMLTKNKKKIFENLAKNHRAVTSADAHVTIFSVLPTPEAKILTKNKKKILKIWQRIFVRILTKNKKIFENLATNHRAVTSADAHVTIFSVLPSPEAKILTKTKKNFEKIWQRIFILTKNKKNFEIWQRIFVRRCPRDNFQRSTSTRSKDIDKKRKKIFENLATYHCAVTSADAHVTIFSVLFHQSKILTKNEKNFLNLATNHRAVTSADAHVTIFSVLLSPEAEILTKNKKKFFLIWQRIIVR